MKTMQTERLATLIFQEIFDINMHQYTSVICAYRYHVSTSNM